LNVLHRPSQFLPSSPSFPCFQHRLRGNTEVEILGLSLVLLLDKCGNYLSKTFNSFKFSITGSVMKVKWVYGFEIWEMKGYNYFLLCQESLNPASFLSACVLTLMPSDFPLCPPSPPSTCSNCRIRHGWRITSLRLTLALVNCSLNISPNPLSVFFSAHFVKVYTLAISSCIIFLSTNFGPSWYQE
jgi:hypothetical protein